MWWCFQCYQYFEDSLKNDEKRHPKPLFLILLSWRLKSKGEWFGCMNILSYSCLELKISMWNFGIWIWCLWHNTKVKRQKCSKCGEWTRRVHGYRNQIIQGRLIEDKPVKIDLKKRRYLCVNCGHTFYEELFFVERYQRHTSSLEQQVMTYVGEQSFTAAGRMVGMSTNRVLRLFDRRDIQVNKVLPEVIAIDEFKGDADKEKFQTIIVDVKNKKVIDILPDRRSKTIENYLGKCDTGNVKVVVMDLSKRF